MSPSLSRVLFVDLLDLGAGASVLPLSLGPLAPPVPPVPPGSPVPTGSPGPGAGAGLAAALLLERAEATGDSRAAAFCVAVGSAVRRGLPTAARATVAARAPLTGGLAEGQVGGSLGRRLARVADALVITGEAPGGDGVLVVEPDGRARLEHAPELRGRDPAATHAALVARFGPCATLRVGPAAEHGARVASLASGEATASYTGRGGLGAAFAAHGLKALVVRAEEVAPAAGPSVEELVRALLRSPRLRARASDGTFELAPARAARGEIPAEAAHALYADALATARERTGCAGCPTPCGWSFSAPGRAQAQDASRGDDRAERGVGGRFGKLWSLGAPLGLERFEDALALAAACDAVGVDAKETGAALAHLARARGALGDRERLGAWIADLGRGAGEGWLLAGGADATARALGAAAGAASSPAREAGGVERGLAARLGAFVSTNGADPMRTFPFLLEAGAERLRALTGLALPAGAEDPDDPVGKGRIVWWHERLVAALDDAGFCAFSAAGLLADGALDLDALARSLGHADGPALIAHGHALVATRRALARRWGALPPAEQPLPPELADLRRELAEYERCCADPAAALAGDAAHAGDSAFAGAAAREVAAGAPAPAPRDAADSGVVRLRPAGPLARRLGAELPVALDGPRVLGEVLAGLPAAQAEVLVRDGELVATAYRAGRRLGAADAVRPGDVVDLVIAIAGG